MMICKQAMQDDICKNKSCCYYCSDYETCIHSCSKYANTTELQEEGCEELVDEKSALIEFNDNAMIIMQQIASISKAKKELEAEEKEARTALEKAMSAYGIKSFDNEILKVVYVPPTTKTTLDSKSLKKDLPDVYDKYAKVSNVKESVRITVK